MADMIKKGVHGCSKEESYIAPTDPLILERLEWFKDQKLALMMHFGPYSQMGWSVLGACPRRMLGSEALWTGMRIWRPSVISIGI